MRTPPVVGRVLLGLMADDGSLQCFEQLLGLQQRLAGLADRVLRLIEFDEVFDLSLAVIIFDGHLDRELHAALPLAYEQNLSMDRLFEIWLD